MIQLLYFLLLLISMGYSVLLMTKFQKHISVYYILLSVAIVVENLGYLQMARSKSIEAALLGNQVACLAYPFLVFFMISAIANLCKVHIPVIVKILCVCTGIIIFLGAATADYVDWYYRNMELVERNGYFFLKKEYGPLHVIGPIYLVCIMCYGLWIVIHSLRQQKKVSHFVSVGSLLLLIFASSVYLGERMIGIELELMPMAYIICFSGILLMLNRVATYDVEGISRESIAESLEYGFVICDKKCRFCGADDHAKQWFPELNALKIDYRIRSFDTDFLQQLKQWILQDDQQRRAVFERDGKILVVRHSVPKEYGGALHCIGIRDDTQQRNYLKLVERYNDELEKQVKEKTARLIEVQNDIIVSMASIVENRDNDTGGHIRRTSDVVRIFVTQLREHGYSSVLTPETSDRIIEAAPLHDFGKIAIPDVILNKPGKFTSEEYELMKQHAQKGAGIVSRILQNSDDLEFKTIAVNIAHYHHEKWNGSGYPCGLVGEEIPLEARIMALADVFDALVSKRIYKDQFSYDKAFSIIDESSGIHFDPVLCAQFLKCRSQIEALYNSSTKEYAG